jgi:transcriptional regulator with XRE-family HTH domain
VSVRKRRESLGLTQEQLAKIMRVDPSTIRNWEAGRSGEEWFEKVARLCDALKCDPWDLLE